MFECTITETPWLKWVNLKGRIDGISSPEVHQQISNLILDGQRTIVLNLEEVNYVSSAGLRVFLGRQKQLKKVGGEIVIYAIPDPVMDIFKTSGFDRQKSFFLMSTSHHLIPRPLHK